MTDNTTSGSIAGELRRLLLKDAERLLRLATTSSRALSSLSKSKPEKAVIEAPTTLRPIVMELEDLMLGLETFTLPTLRAILQAADEAQAAAVLGRPATGIPGPVPPTPTSP